MPRPATSDVSMRLLTVRSQEFIKTLRSFHVLFRRPPDARVLVDAMAMEGQYPPRAEQVVQPGIFTHLRRSEAVWVYLLLAGIPQTAGQVYQAMMRGNTKSKATDELRATYASLYYGSENTQRLRKWGTHHWTVNIPAEKMRAAQEQAKRQLKLVNGGKK